MTWLLRPGVGLARRDADHLQLGTDPPLAAVLPDSRAVRLLLVELAHGSPLTTLDASTAPVLDALVAAGLVVAADDVAARVDHRAGCRVARRRSRRCPPGVAAAGRRGRPPARPLTRGRRRWRWSGARASRHVRGSTTGCGPVRRTWWSGKVPAGPLLGPYVVPGATACLRCVDAHLGEHDPRRALVVEQVATTPPLRPSEPDPALRTLAVAWAVRDLAAGAEGEVPATWSATVALGRAPADRHDVPPPPPLRLRLGRGPGRPCRRPRELTLRPSPRRSER